MKELDLEGLVDHAEDIARREDEMRALERDASLVEEGVAGATPASLERRCRALATAWISTRGAYEVAPAISKGLRQRRDRPDQHPEVQALAERLLGRSEAVGMQAVRLRRRIRDLEMVLGSAIRDLSDESVDARLLRLTREDGRDLAASEIHEAVEKDHEAIDDAMTAWRLMHSQGPIWSVRQSSTVDEVERALERLERTGHATRTGSLFGRARWSIRRHAGDARMTA
jgi:hypothetical protein